MKYFKLSLMILAVGIILFSGLRARAELPKPDPGELWSYITEDSPYTEWGFWDDHQGIQPGNSPHGPYHRVFVNEILLNAGDVPVPYGSILVKESFDQNQQRTNITAMYKVKDYNPDAGDWFWVRYTLGGQAGPAGKVKACIGCHGVKAANDYITTHDIKQLP